MYGPILAKSAKKEQFSVAFLHAVATYADLIVGNLAVDNDSIDCIIHAKGKIGETSSPFLGVQLKCTSQNIHYGREIRYPIPVNNYDDLRDVASHIPRILIVLALPHHPAPWLHQNSNGLTLMRCAYWKCLTGLPALTNTDNVTIRIPTKKRLTPRSLRAIMGRIGRKEPL
ncbi:DUF4365 domain-containing protein [Azospirillum sp. SYSU D00513]|uniref:DUF4365 domain-containing protein n=1 Tax=Azospirillum sp. SYSU D00513 TaxID=2812561 RepID=UPI001A95D94B|nr:DUF4365 domain-containing protein [Azospirillum sp. SYSU D00513]